MKKILPGLYKGKVRNTNKNQTKAVLNKIQRQILHVGLMIQKVNLLSRDDNQLH